MSPQFPREAPYVGSAPEPLPVVGTPTRNRRPSGWYFFKKFLRDPAGVAAIWPSGPTLARRVVADLQLQPGDWIVEYGPGTGSLTEAIAALVRRSPGARYLGIERDGEFTSLLQQRFPGLVFVRGDAREVAPIAAEVGCTQPRVVLSGLPFNYMREAEVDALLQRTRELLVPGGLFRNFSYAHTLIVPGSLRLRRAMRRVFGNCVLSRPILRNLPPAIMMTSTRRDGA